MLASDVSKLAPDKHTAITAGGGVDFDLVRPLEGSVTLRAVL